MSPMNRPVETTVDDIARSIGGDCLLALPKPEAGAAMAPAVPGFRLPRCANRGVAIARRQGVILQRRSFFNAD